METSKRERLILVVDDHREHLEIIKQVLASSTIPCQVVTVPNSSQALDFLHHQGDYQQATRPDLILLDPHLPDGNGQSILLEIKTDASLRRIPTIVLSHTSEPNSILSNYQLQCNSYVVKPQDLIHLGDVMQVIESFWLNIVTLPLE
ncbi:MAG: response regulator [Leptolyngbya sp. SIO3F4]|nr:response regulator [Leptolyngbya sp. SIO3F4]